jgi:hypothetical protein
MVSGTQKRRIPHMIDSEFRGIKIDLKLKSTPIVNFQGEQ